VTTKTKPTLHDLTKPEGRRYYNEPFGVARSIPKGRVLAHNHVQHALYMGHGINGFCCSTNWRMKRCACLRNAPKIHLTAGIIDLNGEMADQYCQEAMNNSRR